MVEVIYEDDDVLAAAKPAGVVAHPDAHHAGGTFLDEVRKKWPSAELLHRLDKDTSGVLLLAKNPEAYKHFKKLFRDRLIEKTYLALVVGKVKNKTGSIALPIGRSSKDFRKRAALGKKGKSREARTDYKVLERFSGDFASPSAKRSEYTLLEVTPKTGRTHQIRSHLASIGHPVACDELYGGKRYQCPMGLTRHFLHAFGLEFTDRNGVHRRIEADLPEDLANTLRIL